MAFHPSAPLPKAALADDLDALFKEAKSHDIPVDENMRLVLSEEGPRKTRSPINNPNIYPHCMSLFLTHTYMGEDSVMYMRGVINNPENPDRATNVGLVVHGVEQYFFIQFKSVQMNPSIYPQRIEAYLRWLERHFLAYDRFHIPMGGDITQLQSQYNPLHANSRNTKQKNKNKQAMMNGPEDLQIFTKWKDVSNTYQTVYGWSPGPLANVIQVYSNKSQAVSTMARFVESQEYCQAVAKLYPYYMVRTFESRQETPEQQFCLDRGLVTCQFCHIYFPNGKLNPIEDEEKREFYTDLEFHIDESQVFPYPPKELLPMPPMPNIHVMSFDIETNNRTTINPFTGMKQTRFSQAIWQPKDIAKNLKDQLYQFEIMEKNRLVTGGADDPMYRELVALKPTFTSAVNTLCKQLKDCKPWDSLLDWYENAKLSYGGLKYLEIPNPLDVDEILVIVAVLSVYGKPRKKPLEFPEIVAFVLEHPDSEVPIDSAMKPTKYSALQEEYGRIQLRTFTNPMERTAAFVELIHKWSPTIMTGWNESVFDEPYIWFNNVFHATYNKHLASYKYKEHGKPTLFGKPNFGLLRRAKLSTFVEGRMYSKNPFDMDEDKDKDDKEEEDLLEGDPEPEEEEAAEDVVGLDTDTDKKKKKGKGKGRKVTENKNPSRISAAMKAHITLPMITPTDGLAVWQNPSFGVKSIFASKGTTPQYSLDNVSSIELKYPGTNLNLPRRKLQVSHSETPNIWKRGGKDMWFFICYCYVDASLPLLLLEKHAKIQLLFALASKCNCSLDIVYNNGMQAKISAFFFASSRTYEGGRYLVPEWGLRGLHWPDVWLHENPYTRAFTFPYMKPRPPGTKGYMGALVMDPSRLLHMDPIATKDYASLYPSTASAYRFDYDKFLTEFMIEYYKVPSNMFATQILGPKNTIFCGDICQSDMNQAYDQYNTPLLKKAHWYMKDGGFINYMILQLMSMRNLAKGNMGKMGYYNKVVTLTPAHSGEWNRDELAPPTLRDKMGKWYDAFYKACESPATWNAEVLKIMQEIMPMAPPGIDDLDYISSTLIQIYDAEQLGLKLILNSIYGFTAPSLSSAVLPLMELAASITSEGRRIIRMTGTYCESQRVSKLAELLNKKPQPPLNSQTRFGDVIMAKVQDEILSKSLTLKSFDLRPWCSIPSENGAPSEGVESLLDAMDIDEGNPPITLNELVIPPMSQFTPAPEALEAIQTFYEEHHLPDHLNLHGGDTDSVMIGYPRAFILKKDDSSKEDHALVQRMATLNVGVISSFLHGVMSLTQEKTAKTSLMVDPKNYFMSVLGMKDLLCKGVEIVRGDTFAICNRLIGYAANELIHKSTYSTFKDNFKRYLFPTSTHSPTLTNPRVFTYIQSELLKVAKGKVTISEFIKHKKLAKMIYKNIPEHVMVAQKQSARGQKIEPGDFIVYTYADTINPEDESLRHKRFDRDGILEYVTKKGGDIAEDVGYLIANDGKIDVEHVMKLIVPMFTKFFRHIVAPAIYPPIDERAPVAEQRRVATIRAQVREKQNEEVYNLLFKYLDDVLKKRLELRMRSILKMNSIINFCMKNYDKECWNCSAIFTTVNKSQGYCPACVNNAKDIQHELTQTLARNQQEVDETLVICRNCIDFAGFPDIEIERCTKYDCEVYEKRNILRINIQQTSRNLQKIRELGTNVDDPEISPANKKQRREHIPLTFGS